MAVLDHLLSLCSFQAGGGLGDRRVQWYIQEVPHLPNSRSDLESRSGRLDLLMCPSRDQPDKTVLSSGQAALLLIQSWRGLSEAYGTDEAEHVFARYLKDQGLGKSEIRSVIDDLRQGVAPSVSATLTVPFHPEQEGEPSSSSPDEVVQQMRRWFADLGVAETEAQLLIDQYLAGPPLNRG
jgi:hypothetical protein